MQDYINLINFLKENDESIKKDLEELRFGCKCIIFDTNEYDVGIDAPNGEIYRLTDNECFVFGNQQFFLKEDNFKYEIIGNNLDYHHIMMYCENNYLGLTLYHNGMEMWMKKKQSVSFHTELNNTKPFHEQDDLVYKQLLEYFISINK